MRRCSSTRAASHTQNVKRGVDGKGVAGMNCATCHTDANPPATYGAAAPPGAPNWHLPPEKKKMVFMRTCRARSSAACSRTRRATATAISPRSSSTSSNDKLVLWGWEPGGRRAPVSVSHDEFVAQFKTWVAAGAPCPARVTRGEGRAAEDVRGRETVRAVVADASVMRPTSRVSSPLVKLRFARVRLIAPCFSR